MAKKRQKRHAGVALIKPNRELRVWWRARYRDPDTGKLRWVTLDRSLRTHELREDWAIRKSRALARRRLELEEGATRASGLLVETAVERFYRANPQLRDSTLAAYRTASVALADEKSARTRRGVRTKAADRTATRGPRVG